MTIQVALTRTPLGAGLPLPAYATEGAAGLDLLAANAANDPIVLEPMARVLVPTGLSFALPDGYEAQVRPRSGLAWKHGITVLNSPGTIDCDYRGEVRVMLINLGTEAYTIERGDRIAQLIIAPYTRLQWDECDTLPDSVRGEGGFGSTGITSG